ncbi:hypothetical protein [Streptomyces roseolilacinus]|uniref:hypothetical protein n=1 Tax=Streptomyces roseolilacinus TaxID=66904 RepID=UPI003813145F
MAQNTELESRRLSTGDHVVFDRGDKTLYLLTGTSAGEGTFTRDELKELSSTGGAVALSKAMLASLYDEFLRISVLGADER